jgi:glycerophosphoryl diester phosphodiesterase
MAAHGASRLFPMALLSMLIALLTGCAMPRYAASLDQVLVQKGKPAGTRFGYRCTAGAHRGASVDYRENTMAALKAADDDPRYAFIEFDVQYSKDQRIVVFHDRRLLRVFHSLRAIGETSFAELSAISDGEIAAYDEVMDALHKKLNIEIKSQGDAQEDERLVDEVMADLRRRRRTRDVLISAISREVVRYVNQRYPEMPTGQIFWLTSSAYLHFDRLTEGLYEDVQSSGADYLLLHVANLRNIRDLLRLKPRDKTIAFWDFGDSMYLVHKDLSDRLWGDSGFKTFCKSLRYRLAAPFAR